jgi:GxxExxY protein
LAVTEFDPIPAEVEKLGRRAMGCGIAVHRALGPGYKEPIYLELLCLELASRGVPFEREKTIKVFYREHEVGTHRLDLLIGGVVIVERKAAECVTNVHRRQVISYLRAANLRLGFVFNFNVDVLTESGIKRVVL